MSGCIFAELLARSPLFPGKSTCHFCNQILLPLILHRFVGEDYIAQLRLICDKLGRPSEERLDFVTSERAKRFMLSLPHNPMKPLGQLFPGHVDNHLALDLVVKMLEFHPAHRLSIERALQHPFLQSLHNPEDEPVANFTFTFDFEHEELSRERIQELIWQETRDYHPEIPAAFPTSSAKRKAASSREMDLSRPEHKGGSGRVDASEGDKASFTQQQGGKRPNSMDEAK